MTRQRRSTAAVLLEFLGSMNLAITLLVAVAIASVVGTVLQQNQAYPDYVIKFGPFWFDVFHQLGLYSVYSASWFLAILGFLVVSTGVCIWRNTPNMIRDMRRFGLNVRERALRAFTHSVEWEVAAGSGESADKVEAHLRRQGYRVRRQAHNGGVALAAKKGAINRLGYILTHGAIVTICLGGLIDGRLPLKAAEWFGELQVETRDIPASQVPARSRVSPANPSFRASVTIPEGQAATVSFISLRDGFLVQELPFTIEVDEFRIEHYPTGQPKSFESDLVIHDPERDEPLRRTIAVNHPLIYKGYAIYQASFQDGGSKLDITGWRLDGGSAEPFQLDGEVFGERKVNTPAGPLTIEFTDFNLFNVNPVPGKDGETEQRNLGPSFTYKVRDARGDAREFKSYMAPVTLEGADYYISGVRSSQGEPFKYLHIPADPDGGVERFMRFNALLHDDERVREVAERAARRSAAASKVSDQDRARTISDSLQRLVALFRDGGFDAVMAHIERTVPADKREEVTGAYVRVLQLILWELYTEVLARESEGAAASAAVSEADARYFDRALNGLAALPRYGAPFYLRLSSFEHIEATGLQITRAPGKNVVYLGCALLIAGVFVMFYVPYRRLWAWVDERDGDHSRVVFAGTGNRRSLDFGREFDRLRGGLGAALGAEEGRRPGPDGGDT